jgi:phage-related protein
VRAAIFHVKAIEALRALPEEARREIGKAIRDLQRGLALGMPLSRPMPSVAAGVAELRVNDRAGTYRTFYYTKSERGILIFHAFAKKAGRTPLHEIQIAKLRLREMQNEEE